MYPKLQNTRALRILDAAKDEFSRRGFDGARIEAIARRARANKQLVFYYYHSKRGLFHAVLTQAARELEAALPAPSAGRAADPPLSRLRSSLDALFDCLARHPGLVALVARAGRSDVRPLAPALNRLVVLLAEGQGLGHIRDDVDPHIAAAQALVLMVAYLALEPVIAATAAPLGDELTLYARWKEAAARLVVDGLAARPGQGP